MYVAACHSIEANWLNDRDQFLHPNDGWRDDFGFHVDCLVYTLFSDFNVIKSKDGINHWIPFTEEEVGARDCFASHFMCDWLAGRMTEVAGRPPYQGDLFATNGLTRERIAIKLISSQRAGGWWLMETNAAPTRLAIEILKGL